MSHTEEDYRKYITALKNLRADLNKNMFKEKDKTMRNAYLEISLVIKNHIMEVETELQMNQLT